MNTSTNRRITPSLIISILALFIAVGGTSYAAAKINGKNIKPGTVAGKALKKNTLTGKQINENKLGIVPKAKAAQSANTANSASTAGDAQTLGGKTADQVAMPAAYARVWATGSGVTVPDEYAHGISAANVTREGSFVCFKGLGFQPKNAMVTTHRIPAGTTNAIPNVTVEGSNFCEGDDQVAVQMVDGATGAPSADARFYITLFR